MTGNGMDFGSGNRSSSRAYGRDFQNMVPANVARGDYQFTGQRQSHPKDTVDQRQEEKYVFDTVVVGGGGPRGGQGRSSTLSSTGGETEARHGGINEVGDGLQGRAADAAVISGDILPVNMASQGYTLDSGEMNVDDEMGEGTGREGSEDALSGGTEGTHGILKINMEEGHGQTSTWSETKTKAGKERKRLPLACIACRRKKIRCSGEKPTCRHCLRSRTPCVYKQSTRKAAPRTDYMAMLDRRLKRMEERLIKNVPKEEINSVLAVTGRSVVRPSMSTNNARSGSSGKKRTAGTAFGNELDAWAHSENPNKHRSVNAGLGAWESSTMKGTQTDIDDGSQSLPSKEIQEHLAEVFFEFVYGQPYFLLHKSSFMRRLRGGTAPPVLVLALCAVSARFSKHPAVRHDPPFLAGEGFATEARRLLLKNFDNPNITNVTVCTMLCLHEFGTCQGGRSWAFGGMATRMAHALQLHKEISNDPIGKSPGLSGVDCPPDEGALGNNMSFVDREIRRRCMWACFVMDRFTSSGTERPCLISETELEIQLPSHDRNLELDIPTITERLDGTVHGPRNFDKACAADNMGVGAYIVRVITLYGKIARYFNQGGAEREERQIWDPNSKFSTLCTEAEQFENNLPERLRYTTENTQSHASEHLFGQFIFVHVALQQIKLFLWKSAMSATPADVSSIPREFVQSASEITLKSATEIAKMLEDIEERGVVVAAPFLGYCAFSAALIHLVRMFSTSTSNIQMEAKRYMEVCLRFLSQIRQYWGLFCYITDNLKRLYRKFSDAVAKGSPFSGHQETRQMLQYGDWFQKYPQGVSASDYERHTKKGQSQDGDNSSPEDAVLSQRSNLQTAEEFFAKVGSRSQRSTPSVPPLPKRQTQSHTRASPVHTSTMVQSSSPQSVHHSQSPVVYQSPVIQQSPIIGVSPAMVSTPPMVAGHGNIDLKLDPQLLNPPMLPRSSDTSPVNFEQSTQHHSSMSSLLSSIASPVSFPNYPVIPRTSAATASPVPTGMHPSQTHQDYFYDLYPAGSDPSAMVAATNPLSSGIWSGFDPHISLTDASAFSDQAGSAWFLPFNSCPPDFETRVGGMGNLNMMSGDGGGEDEAGGGGGGDEGGGNRGNGGGVPHMISPTGSGHTGPGAPPSATAYHDGVR